MQVVPHFGSGYFTSAELLDQLEKSIDIFEARVGRTAALLLVFDNAPGHQKRAPDALSACKMLKGPSATWVLTTCSDAQRLSTQFATSRFLLA
jgi:hypothetical protein